MIPLPMPTQAGAEQERPVVHRLQRLALDQQRARVGAGLLVQRHD
jgi:hypothetical protein